MTNETKMTKRLSRWLRPGLLYIGVPLAAVVVSTGVVFADLPNIFKEKTAISAKSVNANFSALDTRLTQQEAGGRICGHTTNVFTGDIGVGNGWAAARTRCLEQATDCASATVHMCTSAEVMRVFSRGEPVVTGAKDAWVASDSFNCSGYKTKDATPAGLLARGGPADFLPAPCNEAYTILCCD